MKYLTIILLLLSSVVYGQLPAGKYLRVKANGTGFELADSSSYQTSLGIGTSYKTAPLTVANFTTSFPAPQTGTMLHLVSYNTVNGRVSFDTYNNTSFTGSNYQGRRARGSANVPLPVITDDILVALGGDGYGVDSFTNTSVGSMNIRASGTFTNTSKPTYVSFTTTPTGSTTQVERMQIKSTGGILFNSYGSGVFTGTPTKSLQVDASGNVIEGSLGGSGTVTTITATNNTGQTWTITNPTTTPNLSLALTSSAVGLGNVNNTSDASKPVSTATQTALDLKANIASPTFTGTVGGITASMVGLGNVTNESKATMFSSPTFTGTITLPAASISNASLANSAVANLSGTNTGDQTNISGNAATVTTNANLTGDVTSVGNATTIGATKVTNAMLAGSIAYSKLSLTGAILNADLAGSIAYSKLSLTGAILNADLAGSIDLTTKVTGVLPFASNAGSSAATSATTGTMTVNMTTPIITITPSGACTFNGSGGVTGQRATFVVTTSGVSSFVLTWGTNFKSTATLATGTTTAKIFAVSFLCTNGTQWIETGRTAAQ